MSEQDTQWKFSFDRAPHFGHLWELGVREHHLSFEELTTILAEAQAILNSHPLLLADLLLKMECPLFCLDTS